MPLGARWNARAHYINPWRPKAPTQLQPKLHSDISSWYSILSPVMSTANHSTLSFRLSDIQPEYSSPSSTRASSPIHYAFGLHPTPCPSQSPRSTSSEPWRSTCDFAIHTSPDRRANRKGSIDSSKNRRSALSFSSFRSLVVMLGRPRKFKSANAGLLD